MAHKAGDVVVLNSGGPLMTVKAADGEECCCEWFGADGRLAPMQRFKAVCLRAPTSSDTKA
jgi:uncharacterized protein YodC (DUF2158 family)